MSIDRINYQFSKLVGNMISRRIEPFDRTEILQTETESFVFYRLIQRIIKILRAKILSQMYQIPFSEYTLLSPNHFMSDIMLEDLCDLRCTSFELGQKMFARKIPKRDNVFVTPNFLQNFDFFGGYEEKVLETKIQYAGLQLGIHILNEIDEISKFLWWRQEILMKQYKYQIHDFLEYRCFFGIFHCSQEYPSMYQIYLLDNYRIQPTYHYEYRKCPFYLRYQRTDPSDKTTPYLLCEYDMTHTHPLGLNVMHYQDVMNMFEVRRRSRNEYVMYEKNEVRINNCEFASAHQVIQSIKQ